MRRTDILHSINALSKALTSSNIADTLKAKVRSRNDASKASMLPELNAYSILATGFDKATQTLVEIFELEPLARADLWPEIIEESSGAAVTMHRRVNNALEMLPKFAKLLEQKNVTAYINALPVAQQSKEDLGTVSVILLENENEFSRPERLIELLQAVTELYQALARMLDDSPDSLTVLSCDSGSDKSFDFLGAAKVMEQFKELVVTLWDRIVFFGPRRQESVLDVIIKSLPVLEKVSEMEKSAHLGPELAEIIRRQIDGGIRKFVHAGAIIPEIREHTYHEPRALMSPEKKLLMPPSIADAPPPAPPANPENGGSANPDAMKEMLARLERMEQQQGKATTESKPTKRRIRKIDI